MTPLRRRRSPAAVALLLAVAPATAQDRPPAAPREFRAAWVATVDNIDWPSKPGLPTDQQQAELDAILDRARELNLNAVILQVRPACDAFYRSPLEPWSEWLTGRQGDAPEPAWDPLTWAVEGAHARGLELHAWFNPFRARHAAGKSKPAPNHVSVRDGGRLCVRYGEQTWMDPGLPEVRAHTLEVIADVVRRYDVDGVHVDDYFYPYPVKGEPFPDDASWRKARGRERDRAAWRRANVDAMVAAIAQQVHRIKPQVKFGISPFGIARPGLPEGIEAGIDQYEDLYADVCKWLREGWCDYFSPQLYWPIAQRPQSYRTLLAWWPSQNPLGRHLWPGNFTSRVGQKGSRAYPVDEIVRQIELTRQEEGATGNVHFSMKVLMRDVAGIASALRRGPYRSPALVPASPWLDADPPAAPAATLRPGRGGPVLDVEADRDVFVRALWVERDGGWHMERVLPGALRALRLDDDWRRGVSRVALAAVDRAGNESPATVLEVR